MQICSGVPLQSNAPQLTRGTSVERFYVRCAPLLTTHARSASRRGSEKTSPLRIIVPPSEYCPFSTDLTLPITPLSLPDSLTMSHFTSGEGAPLSSNLAQSSSSAQPLTVGSVSPPSSQFLLMPLTPHMADVNPEATINTSPAGTLSAMSGSNARFSSKEGNDAKLENPHSWGVSPPTWLGELGGNTEADRALRCNLRDTLSLNTSSTPGSTPTLSFSPGSLTSSALYAQTMSAPTSSPCPTSSPVASQILNSPKRLALQATGTDTFPSILDNMETWQEEEALDPSVHIDDPASYVVQSSTRSASPVPQPPEPLETDPELRPAVRSSILSQSYQTAPTPTLVAKSTHSFIQRARRFGGRVKELVKRRRGNKYNSGLARQVSFRIIATPESEDGSIIVISAPPPPYENRPSSPVPPCSSAEDGHLMERERTVSGLSSGLSGERRSAENCPVTNPGSDQEPRARRAFRRLSLAAFTSSKID